MQSPEFRLRQLRIDKLLRDLPVETERALKNAKDVANANNTKIGLIELYHGVIREMGPIVHSVVIEKNHIDADALKKGIIFDARLEGIHGDWTKPDPNQPWDLTGLAINAFTHAQNISKERHPNMNPLQPSPSDLFLGLAKLVLNK